MIKITTKFKPKQAKAFRDLERAVALERSGMNREADSAYARIVRKNPDYFDALHMYGLFKFKRGEIRDAARLIERAVKINPCSLNALNSLGVLYGNLERHTEAISIFNQILERDENHIQALSNIANLFNIFGRYQEAIESCDRALLQDSSYIDAYIARGAAFSEMGKLLSALETYRKAIGLNPNYGIAWCGCGNVLWRLQRYDEALTAYDNALALKPDLADAWVGRGNIFNDLKRYDEAFAAYEKALALKPDLANAWLGRGSVFINLKRFNEAFAAYDKSLALKPDLGEAHFAQASLKIFLGEMETAWEKYEYRWNINQMRALKRTFPQPLWLGDSDIKHKTILIHAEQGLGDTLMGCRYVEKVAAQGARIILEVQPALKSLLQNLDNVALLIAKGERIPCFDVHCPIMSLPLAFKTTVETIPATIPYLGVTKNIIEKWRSKLVGTETKVGIAWAGNPSFPTDRDRSILLKNILPILGVKGVTFFSLQKDLRPGDKDILDATPQIVRLDQEIGDFQDTAAIMMSLDLVISSDTSVVNLAGALGRSFWVLLPVIPDWRWLLDGNVSPWYPTGRLFRQDVRGDWATVIDDVCIELNKLMTSRKSGRPN
jgi:tetratricopeptide (TPR) repeat protein